MKKKSSKVILTGATTLFLSGLSFSVQAEAICQGPPILPNACYEGRTVMQVCVSDTMPGSRDIAKLRLMAEIVSLDNALTSGREHFSNDQYDSHITQKAEGVTHARDVLSRTVVYKGDEYVCAYRFTSETHDQ